MAIDDNDFIKCGMKIEGVNVNILRWSSQLKIKFQHDNGMNDEKSVREENAVNERVKGWRSYGILACKMEKDMA